MESTSPLQVCRGLEAIGAAFGRSRWTMARWVKEENFPAGKLPNGEHITTPTLVDQWILQRAQKSGEEQACVE